MSDGGENFLGQSDYYRNQIHQFITRTGNSNDEVLTDALTTNALVDDWLANSSLLRVDKSKIICAAGSKVKFFAIICTGLVRAFYQTPEGKEWNKDFFCEGQTAIAASAYLTDSVAPFSLQALENTTLITTPVTVLDHLSQQHPLLAGVFNRAVTKAFIRNEQREAMLLTRNAEQRLAWLQTYQPELLPRLPQFHIASYLGIDPVSLSRIKRKNNNADINKC